jgi:hypothetical protein
MDPKVKAGLLLLDGYGEDMEIPREELKVPEEFQRKLKPRGWEQFIPALFGRVLVAEVNGDKLIVDGIHRVEGGDSHHMWDGGKKVPSVLYRNCSMEQAAGLFHLLNAERVALRAADEFRSACLSGDEGARLFDENLLDRGLDGWCQERSEQDLMAVGTAVDLHEKLGLDHILYTLDVIADIWAWRNPEEDERYVPTSPHSRILRGFAMYLIPERKLSGRKYLRRWDRENTEMLTSWIATNYPGPEGMQSFLARAQTRRVGVGGGGSAIGVELQIHDAFLKAKRDTKRIEEAAEGVGIEAVER